MELIEQCTIKKLIRNLFALQQSLTNIIVSQENYFDRVRKYYELFFLTEDVNILIYNNF